MPRPLCRSALALCAVLALARQTSADAANGSPDTAHATPAQLPAASGEALFQTHCGICHLEMGTGTIMLGRRLGPDHALLAERTDLDPDYVKHVVRIGIGSMPPQTRVDLSDAELNSIALYLTRPASERKPVQRARGNPRGNSGHE